MGRSPCCDKARVKRGPWSQEEDAVLRSFFQRFGNAGNWITLPQKAGLKRCGKSCRLRWLNYLRPALRHGGFTDQEDNLVLSLYGQIGSKWSVIASKLTGRTDNDVKNYWNTKLKKRYLATTRDHQVVAPPHAPTGDDGVAAADSRPYHTADQTSATPVLGKLDTAGLVDAVDDGNDGDELLRYKSEQLYTELMRIIEQQPTTTGAAPWTAAVATATSSSSSGASPAPGSRTEGSSLCPVDVHDSAVTLPESSSIGLFFDDSDGFGAALHGSFQDLLASATYDDDVRVTRQELLYSTSYD